MSEMTERHKGVMTEELISRWENARKRQGWLSEWDNAEDYFAGKLPKRDTELETLSIPMEPSLMHEIEAEAAREGITSSGYVRGRLARALLNIDSD